MKLFLSMFAALFISGGMALGFVVLGTASTRVAKPDLVRWWNKVPGEVYGQTVNRVGKSGRLPAALPAPPAPVKILPGAQMRTA